MTHNLEGRTEIGARSYRLSNGCFATRMSNHQWCIFGPDSRDLRMDYYSTLRACREWAKGRGPIDEPRRHPDIS